MMTFEDIEAFRENAVSILKKHDQYATAKAVDQAFSALVCLTQYKWERDIAIEQLNELGIGLGERIDGVYLTHDEHNKLLEYKYKYESLCK